MHGYKWPINCTRTRTIPVARGGAQRLATVMATVMATVVVVVATAAAAAAAGGGAAGTDASHRRFLFVPLICTPGQFDAGCGSDEEFIPPSSGRSNSRRLPPPAALAGYDHGAGVIDVVDIGGAGSSSGGGGGGGGGENTAGVTSLSAQQATFLDEVETLSNVVTNARHRNAAAVSKVHNVAVAADPGVMRKLSLGDEVVEPPSPSFSVGSSVVGGGGGSVGHSPRSPISSPIGSGESHGTHLTHVIVPGILQTHLVVFRCRGVGESRY